MADALFNDRGGFDDWSADLVADCGFGDFETRFVYGEGVGVDGGLGDEAVRKGKPDDAADETGAAEQEEVPVEAGGFFERVLACLGS